MTSTAEHSGSNVVALPSAPEDGPSVRRHGLGYRGVWPREGFLLDFTHAELGRGGSVQGLLHVSFGQPTPFVVQFNAAALSTRTSVAKHLEKISQQPGWDAVLDYYCRHVIRLATQGGDFERLEENGEALAPSYLLDPLLPALVATLLYGPSGALKSTLAAAICNSVSQGSPLMGWQPRQAPVLVLDWETDKQEWRARLGAVARGAGQSFPGDVIYHRAAGPLAHSIERVAERASALEVGLIVVDSLGAALGAGREGSDASDSVVRLFGALRLIDATWLLIDHVRGDASEDARNGARPYGSIYKTNLARSSYELRREKHAGPDGIQLCLHHHNVNRGPLQPDRGILVRHGEAMIELNPCEITAPGLGQGQVLYERMRQLLATTGALSSRAIAEELGDTSPALVRQTMRRYRHLFLPLGDRIGLAAS